MEQIPAGLLDSRSFHFVFSRMRSFVSWAIEPMSGG